MSNKDNSHKMVKKDCGWHFGKTGGPCEKCKDKFYYLCIATRRARTRIIIVPKNRKSGRKK